MVQVRLRSDISRLWFKRGTQLCVLATSGLDNQCELSRIESSNSAMALQRHSPLRTRRKKYCGPVKIWGPLLLCRAASTDNRAKYVVRVCPGPFSCERHEAPVDTMRAPASNVGTVPYGHASASTCDGMHEGRQLPASLISKPACDARPTVPRE